MTTKTLSQPPSLLPMYVRAAVTGPMHRGDALPESVYELSEQRIDPVHLTAYEQVCGFRVSDVLPPTYLHVLAFPLSVALMTEQAFPFPLVGLVHIANSITVARPVRADEAVSFTVRAADLRPHAAGRQLDLLAEARVDGELVWSGCSSYLRREKSSSGVADKKAKVVERDSAGTVAQIRVPESVGRKYGAVSGDRNPIHMHALSARLFGFPRAIAHGMWLKARTLAALEGRLPASSYTAEVSFKTPVLLPSTVAIATAADGADWLLDVRNAKSGKPHLSGAVRSI